MKEFFSSLIFIFVLGFTGYSQNLIDCWRFSSSEKISETKGNFGGNLDSGSKFGCGITPLGDLNNDGVIDLAVGNYYNNDGGTKRGAFWILFMNSNGTVKSEKRISDTSGGFTGGLNNDDNFGYRVTGLGDFDGDGIEDVAVSSHFRDVNGINTGSIWILNLDTNGNVKSQSEIGKNLGGFNVNLGDDDMFGFGIGNIGDLNGDGVLDLAVGATGDDDGGLNSGAVYILFMNSNGTVASSQKISSTTGGLTGLPVGTFFGTSVDGLGDMNNDGTLDIVVGAGRDNDGGINKGAMWVLFMNSNGTVSSSQKISDTQGNFGYGLSNNYYFGWTVSSGYDIDGDGINDITSGSYGGNDGGPERGEAYYLFMNANGTVREYLTISELQGGFNIVLGDNDWFGKASSIIGDIDGDGFIDVAFGADQDDNGGIDQGAIYIVHIDTTTPILFTTADTTICEAVPVQLVVSGANTYVWNNGNLLDDSTSSTPILITPTSVILTVEGTDVNGCVGSKQVNVTFNLSDNIFPEDSNMCNGTYLSAFLPGALSYMWNTGDTTSSIPIVSEGQYSVTVSLPDNCTSNGEVDVKFANPVVDLGSDTVICIGDQAILEGWPDDSLKIYWSTGETSRAIAVNNPGNYWVEVGDSNCLGSDTVNVSQYDKLFLEWDSLIEKCVDKSVILEGQIPLASYLWNETNEVKLFQINDTGNVTVTVSNLCESLFDTIKVVDGNCSCLVYIPNAFTPNDDGNNDIFLPEMNCIYSYYHFQIFDRWGKLVFETFDPNEGWNGFVDGDLMHQGIYVWRLEKSFSNQTGVESTLGNVTLLRR